MEFRMWHLCFARSLLAFWALMPNLACIAQNSDEGASLIRALCANAEAFRQFDVLIQHEEIQDIPGHSVSREVVFTRIRCDKDKDLMLCASHRRLVEEKTPGNKEFGPVRKVRLCGSAWNGKVAAVCEVPNQLENVSLPWPTVLRDQAIPDLRCVGIEPFPYFYSVKGTGGGFDNWRNTRLVPPVLTSVTTDRFSTDVNFKSLVSGSENAEFVQSWQFDLEKLVPIRFSRKIVQGSGGNASTAPIQLQTIDWASIKSIYVPVRILGDKASTKDDIKFSVETTAFLDWISLNDQLTEDMFKPELIASDSSIVKLTDPKTCGFTLRMEH